MSRKIAPGIIIEDPDSEGQRLAAWREAKEKRQETVWYVVVGVLFLFLSSFHWGVGVGGLFMIGYGAVRYGIWNAKAKRLYDPWNDDEIDAWEQDEMR